MAQYAIGAGSPPPLQSRVTGSHSAMLEVHVCNKDGVLLRAYALGDSEEVMIGRDEHCDIRIENASVSREHCVIERQGVGLVLRDLASTGGTFVSGDRLDEIRLTDGLEITVGPAVLKFFL